MTWTCLQLCSGVNLTQVGMFSSPIQHLLASITELLKAMCKLLMNQTRGNNNASYRPRTDELSNSNRQSWGCTFCGQPHFIKECKMVDDYLQAGKCMRNDKNCIILPSGAYPHKDHGDTLREHIDEWHQCNPNKLATVANSFYGTTTTTLTPTMQVFTLTTEDCIKHLEDKLASLRKTEANAYNTRSKKVDFIEPPTTSTKPPTRPLTLQPLLLHLLMRLGQLPYLLHVSRWAVALPLHNGASTAAAAGL